MPLMPMPPMPTKCTGPMSRGSFIEFPCGENAETPNLLVCARRRHLQDQIGQPVGGVEPADRPGGRRHGRQKQRVSYKGGDLSGKPSRRKFVLYQPDGSAGGLQDAGVSELVLIECMGQWNQDRWPSDRRKLGNG